LPSLNFGFRADQIRQTFHLAEVKPPVQKGAPGKLAGLGKPRPRHTTDRAKNRASNSAPAMHLKLRNILAGKTPRSRKEQNETTVDRPIPPLHQPQASQPRLWHRSGQHFEHLAHRRSAEPDHRDTGRWRPTRKPKDRVSGHQETRCRVAAALHFVTHRTMAGNELSNAVSPYLLQHKDNPVHWRQWGPEALAEARDTDKPILLSVGYAACHWCHVMAHESFEDPATAAVMNRLFVNIKVDREERPDIDQIYMSALHALGEQGGWPLTMFLTPAAEPIWGGTYFPRESRYGRPAFVDVLEEVARTYRDRPEAIAQNKTLLLEALRERRHAHAPDAIVLDRDLLDRASDRLLQLMDSRRGGIAGAPKFPQASLLESLWRAGDRTHDPRFRDAVLVTLRNIAAGGIYDHVGGGFARYSVDDRWLVPHFEKMLYDNAQLIELMTRAFLQTRDPVFAERVAESIDWLFREMRMEEGAFASSLDADSEGHEGKFYVWNRSEILEALGTEDGAFFADTYDVTSAGNFEGQSIPNRLQAMDRLSPADEARLTLLRRRLLDRRAKRIRPGIDDKILADWNGLAIAALALAGATFDRRDWIDAAIAAYGFVLTSMSINGRLGHAWRDGKLVFPGIATDYAAMLRAAIALHQATLDQGYLADAETLAATARGHHWDADSPGYFLTADDAETLIIRPRSDTDEATPGATSIMAQNLIRLWRLTGSDAYRADADAIIAASASRVAANLFAATGLLNALDLRLGAIDVAIIASADSDGSGLLAAARAQPTPNISILVERDDASLPANHPAEGKTAMDGRATAYVCRGESCSLPVTDPAMLSRLIAG
jgi:uncharacterized protein YyaL (SSP411 family)